MLSRRELMGTAPAFLRQVRRRRKPNLLFLMADDHAGYVMGCDGNGLAQTPNLDRLASESMRFSSHYCNAPVCTPSRQSLLTGQMPHSAGVTVLQTPLSADKPTLAKQLKRAGYQTAVFGKMHFNRPGEPGLHGFDYLMTEGEATKAWQGKVKPAPIPGDVATKRLPWQPFKTPAAEWLNAANLPYPRRDAEMRGTFIAREGMRYLEENRDKPFALWVSLQEPHSPFDYPVEDRGAFDPRRFPVPRVGPQDGGQIPMIFRDLSPEEKQGIIAAYYTSTRFLDRNWGRVLNKLKELGLEEDTVVVYTADHGYDLGQHGRFEKHCGYDPALRVPLMIRWPGQVTPGVVRDFTEHLDLGPALLDMLEAPPLPVQQGQSLRPYLEGRRPERPRTHIVSEYLENEEVFVRTSQWKLQYGSGRRKRTDGYVTDQPTPGRTVKLFHLGKDPGEFVNEAGRYPKEVAELQKVALARFRTTHPDAAHEPSQGSVEDLLDFYLPPRDAKSA
ncbi:MAG: sulfatase-like hydrolase/transferase [Acidobacteria bacterium]|nr:sulfatase-like hydrolase/transferase [Acidobacteriota bacterium]